MTQKSFAVALKRARKAAGLSQKALAARTGCTGSYISQLESGNRRAPRPKLVTKFAKALGVAERRLQELAALERSPAPIRKRLERLNRQSGRARRSGDRLLSTTLFHFARRPTVVNPMDAFVDLPPEQQMLLGRLVGKARAADSPEEALEASEDLLAETSEQERELLLEEVLPGVLGGDATSRPARGASMRRIAVYHETRGRDEPADHVVLDERIGSARAFFLRVAGDDAHPRVEAGDLLLIDPEASPQGGDTVVVRIDERDHIRTFHKQGGRVRLDAPRPDVPPLRPDGDLEMHVVILLVRALR